MIDMKDKIKLCIMWWGKGYAILRLWVQLFGHKFDFVARIKKNQQLGFGLNSYTLVFCPM